MVCSRLDSCLILFACRFWAGWLLCWLLFQGCHCQWHYILHALFWQGADSLCTPHMSLTTLCAAVDDLADCGRNLWLLDLNSRCLIHPLPNFLHFHHCVSSLMSMHYV